MLAKAVIRCYNVLSGSENAPADNQFRDRVASRALSDSPFRPYAEPILDRGEVNTTNRNYEALYIVDATLNDEQVESTAAKYSKLITDQDGEVQAAGKWDRRRLAYDVKGHGEGIYILMYFTGESAVPKELDRVMRIADDVIRHIIVRVEPERVDTTHIGQPQPTVEAAPEEAAEEPAAEAVEEAAAEPRAEEVPADVIEETTAEPVTEEPSAEVVEEAAAEPVEPAEEAAAEPEPVVEEPAEEPTGEKPGGEA